MALVSAESVDKVAELRWQNPRMRASAIARQVGVSRERVRQILVQLRLPTRFPIQSKLCRNCSVKIPRKNVSDLCRKCRQEEVTLICDECGQQYSVLRSREKAKQKRGHKHRFCSRECVGKWTGKHYGRGVRTRKLDWDRVRGLRELGYSQSQIAQEVGISTSYVSKLVKKLGLARCRRGSVRKHDWGEVGRLRGLGYTYRQITRVLGVPEQTVGWILRRLGLTRKTTRGILDYENYRFATMNPGARIEAITKGSLYLSNDGSYTCFAGFKLVFWGKEEKRRRLKFRCPAALGKCHCLFRSSCSLSSYGRTFYIPMNPPSEPSPAS